MRSSGAIVSFPKLYRTFCGLCLLCFSLFACKGSDSAQNEQVKPFDPTSHTVVPVSPEVVAEGFSRAVHLHPGTGEFLYVVDAGRNQLVRLNRSGVRIDSVGGRGLGSYQFDGPTSVDATNDLKIYVSDTGNRRIQQFDRRFQYLGSIVLQDRSGRNLDYVPGWLVANRMGEIIFWDDYNRLLRRVSGSRQLEEPMNFDSSRLRRAPDFLHLFGNTLYVGESGTVHRYSELGQYLGFWPHLGNLKSMGSGRDTLYLLSNGYLLELDLRGNIRQVYGLGVGQVHTVTILGNEVYLLGNNTLFRLRL